jgi:hypothetical protein
MLYDRVGELRGQVSIARSQNSLLSLWGDFQARKPGSGGS